MDPQHREGEEKGSPREEVFQISDLNPFFTLKLTDNHPVCASVGRGTPPRSKTPEGRVVKTSQIGNPRSISIVATLRASAPFQIQRGRSEQVIVHPEDLRFRLWQRPISYLVVFLVDGSGSMGVGRRMATMKGAVLTQLRSCYEHRNRVSVIVFRKSSAKVVLPPTRSFILAKKRLAEIPTGGKTPLSAGLVTAEQLIRRERGKDTNLRALLVLLTDGRTNVSLREGPPLQETISICKKIAALPFTDFLVIDTEDKTALIQHHLAGRIADTLGSPLIILRNEPPASG